VLAGKTAEFPVVLLILFLPMPQNTNVESQKIMLDFVYMGVVMGGDFLPPLFPNLSYALPPSPPALILGVAKIKIVLCTASMPELICTWSCLHSLVTPDTLPT
jgi:hypothetical protein